MTLCSNCSARQEEVKLFDVISPSGIVKLCSSCLSGDAVEFKKPTDNQINNINKSESLYQRLSREAGLDPEEHKKSFFGSPQKEAVQKQEVNLRNIIDRTDNLSGAEKITPQKRDDLVEKFHWVIMRARRAKKITTADLAREIGENESVVKLAEKGVLPEVDYKVITKIETILGINLLRPEIAERIRVQRTQLGFDNLTTKELTISDLKEMKPADLPKAKKVPYWRRFMFGGGKKIKEQEEQEINELISSKEDDGFLDDSSGAGASDFSKVEFDGTSVEISTGITPDREIVPDKPSKKETPATDDDLTGEEIDDLIFGRK